MHSWDIFISVCAPVPLFLYITINPAEGSNNPLNCLQKHFSFNLEHEAVNLHYTGYCAILLNVPERLRWASLVNGWWDSPVSLLETPLSIWRPQLEWTDTAIKDMIMTSRIYLPPNIKDRVTAGLTWCREERWSYERPAGNRASPGYSPLACADSDWHLVLSGSLPCLGTPQVVEWQVKMWGCGLVRWLGSGTGMCLKRTKGVQEQKGMTYTQKVSNTWRRFFIVSPALLGPAW